MIEIIVTCNRAEDRAEAPDAESAREAARRLYDEAYEANCGSFPVRVLYVRDGRPSVVTEGRRP